MLSWTAQFHHLAQFGLYEDDYFFIGDALGRDPSYLLDRLKVFTTWAQGRPIGFFLPSLLSYVGDHLGGLPAIYGLGFLVVVLNTFLFYLVASKRLPAFAALAAAAFFCLFPGDTTKIFLTHDFQLQPSLTFLLAALLLYPTRWRWLSYFVAFGSLITYESPFLVFFAAPLLFPVGPWDRGTLRLLAWHVGRLLALLVVGVAIRLLVGESRAVSTGGSAGSLLPAIVGSLVLGPARALLLFVDGPLRYLRAWGAEQAILALLTFIVAALVLTWLAHLQPVADWSVPRTPREVWQRVRGSAVWQVGATALVMLVLAYGLAFTHYPPDAVTGRGTSVHLAATVGAALLFGVLAQACLAGARRLGWPVLAPLAVGAYLGLLVGYYVTIQYGFISSWNQQRAFWQQFTACCGDLQAGELLIDTQPPAQVSPFISASSWADPLVLDLLYRFPSDWQAPPRLFSEPDWQQRLRNQDGTLQWLTPSATWDEYWAPVPQGNTVLLQPDGSTLARQTGTVSTPAGTLALKVPGASVLSQRAPGPLYRYLLGPRP